MRCELCGGDTAVIQSRMPAPNCMRRRRECLTCGGRLTTYETTARPAFLTVPGGTPKSREEVLATKIARAKRRSDRVKAARSSDPKAASENDKRLRLRAQARAEARTTGRAVSDIYREWGVQ